MQSTLFGLYLAVYLGSALLAGGLGYWAITRAGMRATRLFAMLMGALTIWSLVAASGLLVAERWLQFRLQQVWTIIGLSVVLLWILFTTRYTHRSIRTSPVVRVFGGVYLLLLITALTIPFHDLYYASLTRHLTPFPHVEAIPGTIRIVAIGYTTGGIILGTAYLGSLFQDTRHQIRAPTVILAVAVLLGFIPFLASELNYAPVPTYNHTTFGVLVFILGVSYAVYRHSFYDLAPIGRAILIDVLDDPMVVLDTELRLVDYNPAATGIVSALGEGSIGSPLQEVQPTLAALIDDAARTDEAECTLTVAGESRTFSVLISAISVASESQGYVLLLRDITTLRARERQLERTKTELQEANSELKEANERLDNFASVVAHDLRNPLTVAKGFSDLAAETGEQEHFEKVASAHDRMEELIDDLLTTARKETAVQDTEQVSLETVASDAWSYVATENASLTLTEGIPTVAGDPGRLQQLFENLFRNAIEHGGNDVSVVVGQLDGGSGFFVEDDGTGIPPARRKSVFKHGVTSRRGGTGFGLAIVADIAESSGWTVSVTDGSQDGARFEFTVA